MVEFNRFFQIELGKTDSVARNWTNFAPLIDDLWFGFCPHHKKRIYTESKAKVQKLNKFCPSNSRDDLCLGFCPHQEEGFIQKARHRSRNWTNFASQIVATTFALASAPIKKKDLYRKQGKIASAARNWTKSHPKPTRPLPCFLYKCFFYGSHPSSMGERYERGEEWG